MSKYSPKQSSRNRPLERWIRNQPTQEKEKLNFTLQDKLEWAYKVGATFHYQQKWITDISKYKLCVKARQVGMTTAIAIDSLLDAIFNNEFVILIVSPSQRQSDRMMWYINKAFNKLQKQLGEEIRLFTHKRDCMVFEHGSELWSLPNNPTTVMGFDADRVIIDEAGVFPTSEGHQIYEATMGSLGAKDGGMQLSGMPYGRIKFFYDKYQEALLRKNNFSIHTIPWTERANIDPKYKRAIEEQKQYLSPIQFSQTYECVFTDENVVLFPYELLENCINEDIRLISGEIAYGSRNPVFLGIDFARKVDKTSIIGVEKYEKDRYRIFLMKDTRETYDRQIEIIKKLNINTEPQAIYIDESGPGVPMLDLLKKEIGEKIKGIPFDAQHKERLMLDLRNLLMDKKIELPNHRELLDELHSIEKSVTDLGNVRYIAPHEEGGHADKAFALALAVNQTENTEFRFQII